MNVTVNATASYSYDLYPDDIKSIEEDVEDVLRAFNGHGIVLEVKVDG